MLIRICFVCLGNICRSPTAEGVMRQLVDNAGLSEQIAVDSAGTGSWHTGQPPDSRSVATAKRRGITLGGRARQFRPSDWEHFDYVLAMDGSNYEHLRRSAPSKQTLAKLSLLLAFDPDSAENASVPDPYYMAEGFDEVIDLCLAGCRGLLEHICQKHGLSR